ncbi:MAG: putative bifunctional diguanylate cyclase/phosphodiesterase [Rhodospirillales bacterium]
MAKRQASKTRKPAGKKPLARSRRATDAPAPGPRGPTGGNWTHHLVDSAPYLVCLCEGGAVTYLNETGKRWLKLRSAKSAVGRPFRDFVHRRDREALADLMDGAGGDERRATLRLARGKNGFFDAKITVKPLDGGRRDAFMVQAHDITALQAEQEARRRVEENLNLAGQVISNLNDGVLILDARRRVTAVNPAFTRITRYEERDLVGKPPPFRRVLGENRAQYARMWKTIEREGRWEGEYWTKTKEGEDYAERLSVSTITDDDGEVSQYATVINDITERKQDEERIRYQANYDELTGLPNRSLFLDRLNQTLAAASRNRDKVGLMFIDLDGFKLVNDTLGHDIGDLLLQEAAERLKHCVRATDTVARLGGDEFTVVMPRLHDPRVAPLVAQRILDSLAQTFQLNGHETFVSASVGITVYPEDATEVSDLLRNADGAMYQAKERGKANYQFFTDELNRELQERMVIKNGLAKAMDQGELALHYQPKMNLESGAVTGVEALMRWDSEELGSMAPNRFIPVLEETGMVIEIGEWAIRTACAQHRKWRDRGLPPVRVAVNLSTRQLHEISFVSVFERALKENGIGADGLEIEITENMLMSDAAGTVAALHALHDLGIHVTMDDFGTGYSSLSVLKRFPIDSIKIDGSFVADIATSADDAEIIRTIITMGKTLNREVVAEGVENQKQVDLLREYRCDQIQGYFICPPVPAQEITEFLMEKIAPPKG